MKELQYIFMEWFDSCSFAAKMCPEKDVEVTLDTLEGWAMWSGLIGVLLVLFLLVLLFFIHKGRQWFWEVVDRCLSSVFVLVWFMGFVVYDIGMYTGERPSLFLNMPMAVLHAFGMFLLDSDVSAIHKPFHDSYLFMCFFSFAHFFAAAISMIFVVRHFGFNIIAWFRMGYNTSWLGQNKENTYVFWGMNDAMYYLAKSIKTAYREKTDLQDKSYRIVVVRINHDKELNSVRNGMERLFHFLSLRNEDLERLEDLDCLTTNTFVNLSSLSKQQGKDKLDILKKELGLSRLAKLITNKTTEDVHLFFLSDDEHENIQAIANLMQDVAIKSVLSSEEKDAGQKVVMYCHARCNSIHRVIEDEQPHPNLQIKVVDSSHISVELMKRNKDLQPVNFVDIEDDATVSSAFYALVVGFGEVGLDAVRFLYEFGAFVKRGSTDKKVERSDFHCDVVDKVMSQKAGLFHVNSPAIIIDLDFEKTIVKQTGSGKIGKNNDVKKDEGLIALYESDCQSVAFYNLLRKKIRMLNYVVLAMDSDEMNISLAVRIFRLAIQEGNNLKKLCIMVRVQHDNDGHIERIAEHYNRLWMAQVGDTIKPIRIFGAENKAYSYDNIVDNRLENEAKAFNKVYENGKDDWEKRHSLIVKTDSYTPKYEDVMAVRRKENQDFSNSLHKATKQKLIEIAMGVPYKDCVADIQRKDIMKQKKAKDEELEVEKIQYVDSNGTVIDGPLKHILDVLAQTEHLRWNASHEILGYQFSEDKEETKLLHNCLKPWEQLTTDYQSYDYNVVDVSLDINSR